MLQFFSNRRLLFLTIILIVSNLLITGISILVIYNKSISYLEITLLNVVQRQSSLVTTLHAEGKSDLEILQFIRSMREKYYRMGENGEFVIGRQIGDSIDFLLTSRPASKISVNNAELHALPLIIALQGKTGTISAENYAGRPVLASYTYAPTLKWGIVAEIPINEVIHPYLFALGIALLTSVLIIICCVFLFLKISNPIIKRIVESEEHYRSLFENSHISMLLIQPETSRIIDANPAACKFYGYEKKEILNLKISDINISSLPEIKKALEETQSGVSRSFIFKHRLANGNIRDVEVFTGVIKIKGERLIYSIIDDITERIQTEIALKESEERYKRITSGLTDYLYTVKVQDGKPIETIHSETCKMVIGYAAEEFAADPDLWIRMVVPEDQEMVVQRSLKILNGFEIPPSEHRVICKDGKIKWISDTTIPKYNFKGELIAYDGIIKDITERKNAEDVLVRSEALYRNLFDNMLNGFAYCKMIILQDKPLDFIYLNVNKAFESLTGLKDVVGRKISEILPDIQQTDKALLEKYERVATTGFPETFEIYVDAMKMWFLISVYCPEKEHFVALFEVITERKEAEFQLMEKNEEIASQNEEYRQINDELVLAKEHAEESDRLKTAFLQNMSHEIRTPMNAIMGFSDLLIEQADNKQKLVHFSNIIKQRSKDLLDLIDEILDISKIESGQLPVHPEVCDLNTLLMELNVFFKENQKKGGKQNIELKMCEFHESSHLFIITDKVKLKQIFINLIGNAFKYTEKGEIRVNYRFLENQTLLFSIADTGIGIPIDKQQKVFERFVQLNYGNNRQYGGTGLGLAIVKGLVNLLGGEIWVESEPSVGSTFYFTLPFKSTEPNLSRQKLPEVSDYYDFSDKNILIVEDDLYNSEYLKEVLNNTGARLWTTTLAGTAVSIALSEPINLILMDISLPDFSGYEAVKQILSVKSEIKIIAQTAYAATEDRLKALQAGCANYISKPVKRELLLAMVNDSMNEQVSSEI